jgi:lipid-A-disaccharide synthase
LPRLAWPGSSITLVDEAREALFHARAAVVASGTATVQALTIGTPFVMVYRVSKLTFALAKRMVRYPAEIPAQIDADGNLPVGMVNLIAGKRIVPELLNERFTAENLAAALRPLLADTAERTTMSASLAEARAKLVPEGKVDPVGRVCDAVESLLASKPN